jgi:HK97 family phage prohead protease
MTPEIRCLPQAELRVTRDGKAPVIAGYAAVFNSLSQDLGGFRELIRPGAFARGLAGADVRALINHDRNLVLGRNTSGTLRLSEDSRGLRIEVDPPDVSYARDLLVSLERGDISGMSFRFYVAVGGESWRSEPQGPIRELTDIEIDDVSVVVYPAYTDTTVAVRSLRERFPAAQPKYDPWIDRARSRLRIAETELAALTTKP